MKKFVLFLIAFAAILPAAATVGVTVNGTDISAGSGTNPAWTYSGTNLALTASGASYVISGNNIQGATTNAVSIQAQADCTVIASNLVIDVSGTGDTTNQSIAGVSAFDCGAHAVTLALWSEAGRTNTFKGGYLCTGIRTTGGSLVITNLNEAAALSAQGGAAGAGIGGGLNGDGGQVRIFGGLVTATGGDSGAGIGGGAGGAGGTVTIPGGNVTATGGAAAAGIGGGVRGAGGTVTISGGIVTATSGLEGAGIGGGYSGAGGTVTISGGTMTATGVQGGAGIGGGAGVVGDAGGAGGTVTVSGGTVIATGDTANGAEDIGHGCSQTSSGANTFTGGSIHLGHDTISLVPRNGIGRKAFCVTFTNITSAAALADLTNGLAGYNYGVRGIVANAGKVYAWLPKGAYSFTINGQQTDFVVGVGVTVNGTDLCESPGANPAWTYDGTNLALTASGASYVISGTNILGATTNAVSIRPQADCTVIASNLVIDVSGTGDSDKDSDGLTAFDCGTNAVILALWNDAGTTNTFKSGVYCTGIAVVSNGADVASLAITNLNASAALSAQGGYGGAGIGGSCYAGGGQVRIFGGLVTATGGDSGAGIGGGAGHAGGTVTISGGTVMATGRENSAGIGGGDSGAAGGTVTISGGTVTATGGNQAAGIGGGAGHAGGTVTISGGMVSATGGDSGAGIGGGAGNAGGTVTVSSGTVTATGGDSGAGIGGGAGHAGGTVTVSGGTVSATGGWEGAGIGGGCDGAGGTVTISGGTVVTTGDQANGAEDIGYGSFVTASGTNTFTGGSIRLMNGTIALAPSNGTARVWCVTVTGLVANAALTLDGLDMASPYGGNGIVADAAGHAYLWLPDGDYSFALGGNLWRATVNGTDTMASYVHKFIGIAVNGTDIGVYSGSNPAWTYNGSALTLTASGASYVISGSNIQGATTNIVSILARADCTVIASNLTVDASSAGKSAFDCGGQAVNLALWSDAGSTNTFKGGTYCAGIRTTDGSLAITKLNDSAALFAQGDIFSAGIGGGLVGAGGTVTVSGGTVIATGGDYGAGIGGSFAGAGGTVTVSGGTVIATGDHANGAEDIGYGSNGTSSGANTFTGGSICLAHGTVTPAPRNGAGTKVYCATFTNITSAIALADLTNALTALNPAYGVRDITAPDGMVSAWLPGGIYSFTIDGQQTELALGMGLFVNGTDISAGSGTNRAWTYDGTNLALTASGASYVISGSNIQGATTNFVSIRPQANCTVIASNLFINASVANASALFIGTNPYAVTLLLAGTNTLGGGGSAGISIEKGSGSLMISNLEASATLRAWGGSQGGAGIGGGSYGTGGTVTIAGGTIVAAGGLGGMAVGSDDDSGAIADTSGSAGIGGGYQGAGGTVTIFGGTVTATGDDRGAGIGGGYEGDGGTLTISGGTVIATGDAANGAEDIGHGRGKTSSGANTFTGGSIDLANGSISQAPSNGTARVWCVTVAGFAANAALTLDGLAMPSPYGGYGIVADASGKVYLWLPDGDYSFALGGSVWHATVSGADTTANYVRKFIGVAVNGADIGTGSGANPAWMYDGANLSFQNAGPYTVTGANGTNSVSLSPKVDGTTLVLSNLTIDVSALAGRTALWCGGYDTELRLLGANTLTSGSRRPGVQTTGATLVITNLEPAAALVATGGGDAAGIGGAYSNACGTVRIYGGVITAVGQGGAAGIGGGSNGAGGTVTVSGGTVIAARGSGEYQDIGGWTGASSGTNTFTGGSIRLVNGSISPAPSNGTARVWCVTVTGLVANAALTLDGFDMSSPYGGHGIVADASGKVYLWLPDGDYRFALGGNVWRATVSGADTTANYVSKIIGISVNGVDISAGFGTNPAWTFDGTNLALTASGASYVISGNNNGNAISIQAQADCTVIASNLVIDVSGSGNANNIGLSALDCGAHAVTLALWSDTGRANTFKGGAFCAGIRTTGGSLTITNLNASAALCAEGDDYAAGIGGGHCDAGGTVTVFGGTVTATGGACGAGIGGGDGGAGGTVTVFGGVVSATGHAGGTGIGGGDGGAGGTVTISGGTVTAIGGSDAAGIGGGYGSAGGTVTISGGTVIAKGDTANGAEDIGYGHYGTAGANTFTGGSIRLANDAVSQAPSNSTARVWCVTFTNITSATLADLTNGLAALDYGVRDITALDGKVYAWLPSGTSYFTFDGKLMKLVVDDSGNPSFQPFMPVGVTVNGRDIAYGSGDSGAADAWSYTNANLSFLNAGPYVVSGANGTNSVSLSPKVDGTTLVLSNLTIDVSGTNGSALYIGANPYAVTLLLSGTNTLVGGGTFAGITIEQGTGSLAISNLEASAALVVRGGTKNAAGIGGGRGSSGGTVVIRGGAITATGSGDAAGIGGGYKGTGGAVWIYGGTITAAGTGGGSGIGGGAYGNGGNVQIFGGLVKASGGNGAAGIGGGWDGNGGTLGVSGGTVRAIRGDRGSVSAFYDIGGEIDHGTSTFTSGANTFTGGSVWLANGLIAGVPSNGTERVWCVTNGGFVANAPVSIGLSASYGTRDLVADGSGNIYLWLPAGGYIEGGSSTDDVTTNAVLRGFGVSAAGAVTGPTNVTLAITGFTPEEGVTNWTPKALSPAHVETIYATNLTDAAVWSPDRPTNAPALFLKLRVR